MPRVALALVLGWWFAAYTIDRFDFVWDHMDPIRARQPRFESTRLHGPYPTPWACLRDAFDVEHRSRLTLMTTLCFEDAD